MGNLLRAYLSALSALGYSLELAILVGFRGRQSLRRRLITSLIGYDGCENLARKYRGYRSSPAGTLYRSVIEESFRLDPVFFESFRTQDYCHNVERLVINNYDDQCLIDALKSSGLTHFIFAGHNLFRGRVLDMGMRYLHAHPGIVPDIRGVDCFLWSVLYRGCPGYSVIYLDQGVDTGDIVLKQEHDLFRFRQPSDWKAEYAVGFYQYLLSHLNLQLRAELMARAVRRVIDAQYSLGGEKQQGVGRQFYSAHGILIKSLVRRLMTPHNQ